MIEFLKEISEDKRLNFDGLIQLIESEKIPMTFHVFPDPYTRALGATSDDGVLLNYRAKYLPKTDLYHLILHEIGHYLRVRKKGGEAVNIEVTNLKSAEELRDHLLYEERFAEKYATLTFHKLNRVRDNASIKLDFNDINFFNGSMGYAKFLFNELQTTGLSFFDYTRKALNII
jgi:hypothetical protein